MKSTFFTLFSLLLFLSLNYARKEQTDYWKNMMKDQPMPEAIKARINQGPDSSLKNTDRLSGPVTSNMFNRDFDTRLIAIIYHSQPHSDDKKTSVEKSNSMMHGTDTKKVASSADDTKPGPDDSHA